MNVTFGLLNGLGAIGDALKKLRLRRKRKFFLNSCFYRVKTKKRWLWSVIYKPIFHNVIFLAGMNARRFGRTKAKVWSKGKKCLNWVLKLWSWCGNQKKLIVN